MSADTIDEVIEALQKASAALEAQLSPRAEDRKPRPGAEKASPITEAGKSDNRTVSEKVRAWVASSVNGNQFSVKDSQRALGLTENEAGAPCERGFLEAMRRRVDRENRRGERQLQAPECAGNRVSCTYRRGNRLQAGTQIVNMEVRKMAVNEKLSFYALKRNAA